MHVGYPVVLAALLFSVGVYGVLARRNAILVLMSVELMLNAVNLNLITFDVWLKDTLRSGQTLTLYVIVLAAAEVGLGLAIVLLVFRNRATIAVDSLRELADRDDPEPVGPGPGSAATPASVPEPEPEPEPSR
jgi:NADH-quinone oxidoreductase subunit K